MYGHACRHLFMGGWGDLSGLFQPEWLHDLWEQENQWKKEQKEPWKASDPAVVAPHQPQSQAQGSPHARPLQHPPAVPTMVKRDGLRQTTTGAPIANKKKTLLHLRSKSLKKKNSMHWIHPSTYILGTVTKKRWTSKRHWIYTSCSSYSIHV